mgnify:CR=1 FL=1
MTDDYEKQPNHYVDGDELFKAISEYAYQCRDAEASGKEKPRMSNYLGDCILKIATHCSYQRNFIGYSFREEMIMDGVEDCIRYAHNFNPDVSRYAWFYLSRCCHRAFVRRIKKEKIQQKAKAYLIQEYSIDSLFEDDDCDSDLSNQLSDYIRENSFFDVEDDTKKVKKTKPITGGLSQILEDVEDE